MDTLAALLLERLLATSAQTALLVALVWVLCRHPRLPPSTQCWLWWLVALQALVGLAASPVEVPLLPPPPAEMLPAMLPEATLLRAVGNEIPGMESLALGYPQISWQTVLAMLWLTGSALAAYFTVRSGVQARSLLRRAVACGGGYPAHALRISAERLGLRRPPRLLISDEADSPLLLAGILRPVLLLPARRTFSRCELEMVFAHELAHLQRRDFWWGLVPALARVLFFFHPLLLRATREYALAREAACDAAAVDGNTHSRHDYGRLVVELGTAATRAGVMAAASPTFEALQRRLNMLATTSHLSLGHSIVILVLVAGLGIVPLRLVAADAPPATRSAGSITSVPAHVPERTAQAATTPGKTGQVTPPARQEPPPEPSRQLRTGDILRVHVWQHAELSVVVSVMPEGTISTPLVDGIAARGRTPRQLAQEIESRLSRFVRSPRVSVLVMGVGSSAAPVGQRSMKQQVERLEAQRRASLDARIADEKKMLATLQERTTLQERSSPAAATTRRGREISQAQAFLERHILEREASIMKLQLELEDAKIIAPE